LVVHRVWIDGRVVATEDAHLDALAAGVLTGTGVFESMKVLRGEAFALRRHLARLARSAAIVDLPVPDDSTLREAVNAVLADWTDATRVRITIAAGRGAEAPPTTIVHAERTEPWPADAHVVVSPWVRNERAPSAGAKTTSYVDNVLARRDAVARGADEALLCDTQGHLSEGTASNVFVVVDGRLCTPSLANGCLGGMTRELLCELVAVDVRDDLTLGDLAACSEAFLTSSTRDVHPIATVDGRPLPQAPGPLTAAAAWAMAELQERTTDP
jgi:branched-chain amino acid aminotransferase